MYKKIISFILCLSLSVSCISFVFADDLESDSSDSSSSASDVVTLEPITSVDTDVIEVDNKLRELASIMATNSTYDANDIYLLLASVISGNKIQVLDSSVLSKLGQIYDSLYTGNGTSGYPIASYLADAIGYNANSSDDIMTLLSQISLSLGGYVVSSSAEGVWGYIVTIKGVLDDIYDSLGGSGNIGGLLGTIDTGITNLNTKLQTVNTNLGSILGLQTTINNSLSTIHSDLTTSNSSLSHIDSDLHDLKQWLNDTFYLAQNIEDIYYLEYCFNPNDYTNNVYTYPVSSGQYRLNFNPIVPVNKLDSESVIIYQKYDTPITIVNSEDYSFVFNLPNITGQGLYEYTRLDTYFANNLSFELIDEYTLKITIKFKSTSITSSDYVAFFIGPALGRCISPNDYPLNPYMYSFVVSNTNLIEHIDSDLHSQLDILNRFKELYASDDLVSAKEEQQTFEDTALEDFTGEGEASASLSDLGNASDVSKALKNGLSSGGSSGNALEVFNSSSSFWGWFSQDCRSYFVVTVPSTANPQPVLRSSTSLPKFTDDIPDVLTPINDDYERGLGK